jgi:hypothetical protein
LGNGTCSPPKMLIAVGTRDTFAAGSAAPVTGR